MEVKAGYKITEVGVIPEVWEVRALSEVSTKIQDGTHFSPKTGGNEFLYLTSKNIKFGYLDLKDAETINEKQHREIYKRCDVKYGDLLLTKDGANTGNAAINNLEEEFSLLSSVAFIRFDPKKHFANYFLQQILSFSGQQRIKEAMIGNAITRLTLEKLNKIKIPVASFYEQTAIAGALSDVDSLISSLEKQIAKKKLIKQGAMQELLKPKEGWENRRLGEIAEIIGGGTPSTFNCEYWNGLINWFTPTEVGLKKYIFESSRKITRKGLLNSSARILPIGSILLTTRAGIGDVSILMSEGCTNQGFQSLVVKEGFSNEYLYYLLLTLKGILVQNASGSTFLEISPNRIRQIEVKIPDIENQMTIASKLSDIDLEIDKIESKLEKCKYLKQGMMQELLTGRIRLI